MYLFNEVKIYFENLQPFEPISSYPLALWSLRNVHVLKFQLSKDVLSSVVKTKAKMKLQIYILDVLRICM